MKQSRHKPSPAERLIAVSILAVLCATALWVGVSQRRFNPAVRAFKSLASRGASAVSAPSEVVSGPLQIDWPDSLKPMAPPEVFTPQTLSDKINGKAELYFQAGFQNLACRRMSLLSEPAAWAEFCFYDMGSHRNAFAVFSQQRRSPRTPLDIARFAYRAENGIFLIHGRYYAEFIAAVVSEPLYTAMSASAAEWVQQVPATSEPIDELALFPETDLVPDSFGLLADSAFSFEGFDQIFTARYRVAEVTATAFLSRRASTREAEELVSAYADFLTTYGGEPFTADPPAKGAKLITILDTYEIVFSVGRYVAGIHESTGSEAAVAIAGRLYRNLAEVSHE